MAAESAGTRGTEQSRGTAAGVSASQPALSSVTGGRALWQSPLLVHLKVPSLPLVLVLPKYLRSPVNNIRAIELLKSKSSSSKTKRKGEGWSVNDQENEKGNYVH